MPKRRRYTAPSGQIRGFPGILLTCLTNREYKCRAEALDLLEEQQQQQQQTSAVSTSLEAELTQLRQKPKSAFRVVDTGCAGSVLIVCTKGRAIVPPLPKESPNKKRTVETDDDKANHETQKLQTTTTTTNETTKDLIDWDPIQIVQQIKNEHPTSRFISRILPLQTITQPTLEHLRHAVAHLIQNTPQETTFAIRSKRRHCTTCPSQQVIETVAKVVQQHRPKWKVHLDEPDHEIRIEICKTFAGVSVAKTSHGCVDFRAPVASDDDE